MEKRELIFFLIFELFNYQVLIHKNNIDKRVEELATAMGIDKKQIVNTNDGIWDVTIIIGNDFKSLSSYKELLIINSEMTNE